MDTSILLSGESKNLDKLANSFYSLDDSVLVENAGRACAMLLVERKLINLKQKILVLAGAGNNGSDGLVIARALLGIGYSPVVYEIKGRLESDLRKRLRDQYQKVGGRYLSLDPLNCLEMEKISEAYDVFVDCLTGTGFKGQASESALTLVKNLNSAREKFGVKVISIDLPSYNDPDLLEEDLLNRDSSPGMIADCTVSIQTLKRVHVDPTKIGVVGKVFLVDVGIPINQDFKKLQVSNRNLLIDSAKFAFSESSTIHKGNRPKILVIGGSKGKEGAAILSALGALRTGASLVTIASTSESVSQLMKPEMMFHDLNADPQFIELKNLLNKASAAVIGPGLGVSDSSLEILKEVLTACKKNRVPLLIDADAIVMLGNNYAELKSLLPEKLVLTPHPKEFTFLIAEKSVEQILKNRFEISKVVAENYGAVIVLKGPRTLISNEELQRVNPHVEPVLAIGGSGDVLSGVISAILPRLNDLFDAVTLGVYLHGESGRLLRFESETNIGALASEIADRVPNVISALCHSETQQEFIIEPFA